MRDNSVLIKSDVNKPEVKPILLLTRRTDPYKKTTKPQDQELPQALSYEQYLTGIASTKGNVCLQFIFNGGYRTQLSDG